MELWLALLGVVFGLVIIVLSSEKTVDQLIKITSSLGASAFTIGFVVSSLGSDLPELVNSIFSSYLGHGDISVGDSFGSVLTQISLIPGLIPFFCTFCRLIPRRFAFVGLAQIVTLLISVFLASDGSISRFDGLILILLWVISMYALRKIGKERIAVEKSEEIIVEYEPLKIIVYTILGFVGIAAGSYILIESVLVVSRQLGISEYIISFFLVAFGTSLPELVLSVAAIKKRHYELALGDIIGSCIVDATLGIGLGPLFFPITVSGGNILITGIYASIVSLIVVSVLSFRGYNDKRSGFLFIFLYILSYLILIVIN